MTGLGKQLVRFSVLSMIVMTLTACGTLSKEPASIKGECGVFTNPGFAVRGKRLQDQRAIDAQWIEPGIAACGWARPETD